MQCYRIKIKPKQWLPWYCLSVTGNCFAHSLLFCSKGLKWKQNNSYWYNNIKSVALGAQNIVCDNYRKPFEWVCPLQLVCATHHGLPYLYMCYNLVESLRSREHWLWDIARKRDYFLLFSIVLRILPIARNFGTTDPTQMRFSAKCTSPNEHFRQ